MVEAGYPDGFKAKLWVNDNPVRRDTAVILQRSIKTNWDRCCNRNSLNGELS